MTKRRIGVFGGSFSPPHLGHLHAAKQFVTMLRLDKLYIIPAYHSPGKVMDGTPAHHRLAMCRLAFAEFPMAEVLDIEISRGGVSYTVDTLTHLANEESELFVLCGTDAALALDRWKSPEALFSLATFVCMPREAETDVLRLKEKNETYQAVYGKGVEVIPAVPRPLSSTEIRSMISQGDLTYQNHLCPAVAAYITQNGLYQ